MKSSIHDVLGSIFEIGLTLLNTQVTIRTNKTQRKYGETPSIRRVLRLYRSIDENKI